MKYKSLSLDLSLFLLSCLNKRDRVTFLQLLRFHQKRLRFKVTVGERRDHRLTYCLWTLGIQFTDNSIEKSTRPSDAISGGFAIIAWCEGRTFIIESTRSVHGVWLLFSRALIRSTLKPVVKHVTNSFSNREQSEIGKEGKQTAIVFTREILPFETHIHGVLWIKKRRLLWIVNDHRMRCFSSL